MKRLFLCGAAVLLICGALATKPAGACPINNTCTNGACNATCVSKGYESGSCSGVCHLCQCLA